MRRHKISNVEKTPLMRRVKKHGRQPANLHYIESVYTTSEVYDKAINPNGDLQEVYITMVITIKPLGNGPRNTTLPQKLASI